jgi:hypothetical protein
MVDSVDLGRCLGRYYHLLGQVCAEGKETYLVCEPKGERGVDRSLRSHSDG